MSQRKAMKVLIGYDGSDHANAAIEDLRRAGLPREVTALIVSVSDALLPPLPPSSYEIIEKPTSSRRVVTGIVQEQARASQALEQAQATTLEGSQRVESIFPYRRVATEGMAGTPSEALIQKAKDWKADLIVVGSKGRSALGRLMLGSVSRKVATEACCSVRVGRRPPGTSDGARLRLIVGVDGSPSAERAVRAVGMRVWPDGTEVRVITVDNSVAPTGISGILPTAAAWVKEENEEAVAKARLMIEWAAEELRVIGLIASSEIREGDPQRTLLEEAQKWEADCIFVGARGFDRTLERFRAGSVSTGVVTDAHCSVEIIRSAEEVA